MRQEERSETTRRQLIDVATELFATRGFGETSIEDLVRRAGVTRGALYHHFESKQEIFVAVFEAAEQAMVEKVAAAALGGADAWRGLRAGCEAFLEVCLEPAFQRIALRDAPAVLGWDAWREVDARYALGLVERGFEAAMAEGHLRTRPAGVLAHLMLGALTEAAMLIARAKDQRKALVVVKEEIDGLLEALRVEGPSPRHRATRKPAGARAARAVKRAPRRPRRTRS